MPYLIAALGISLWTAFYQLLKGFLSRNNYTERIGVYTGQVEISKEEKPKKQNTYHQGLGLLAKSIDRAGIFDHYKENIRKKLAKANVLMRPEEYIAICIILFVVSGFMGALVFGRPVFVIVFAVPGSFIPSVVLKRTINKRLKTLNEQLGDTIAILSNAMKAGHSFFQAVDSVGSEITGPVADEFAKLQKEISLGVETETALENMAKRVGSDDLELMVTAVLIQRQIGGNLAEVLDNISGTIRQRIRAKGEIKTLTAQGRLSGLIIAILPFILAGIVTVMNPEQMKPLVTEPLGVAMVVAALVMELIGIVFIRKIINVEV